MKEHLIMKAAAHVVKDFSFSGQKDYLYPSCLVQEWKKGSYLEELVKSPLEPKAAPKVYWIKPPDICLWPYQQPRIPSDPR